jgi:hypothetical protein
MINGGLILQTALNQGPGEFFFTVGQTLFGQ